MPRYMVVGKYNSSAAAAVNQTGMVGRRQVIANYVEGIGGTFVDVWAIAVPNDFDFVITFDHDSFDAGKLVAHNLTAIGSGGFDRGMTMMLASFEEVDAARATMPGYTAPGH